MTNDYYCVYIVKINLNKKKKGTDMRTKKRTYESAQSAARYWLRPSCHYRTLVQIVEILHACCQTPLSSKKMVARVLRDSGFVWRVNTSTHVREFRCAVAERPLWVIKKAKEASDVFEG